MHAMASGCCPRHASLHPDATTVLPPQRPDCCALRNPPARPVGFLTTQGALIELSTHVSAGPEPIVLPPDAGAWLGESPPFSKLVFRDKDQSPDLDLPGTTR